MMIVVTKTVSNKLTLYRLREGRNHLSLSVVSLRSAKAGQSRHEINIWTQHFQWKLKTKVLEGSSPHSSTFREKVHACIIPNWLHFFSDVQWERSPSKYTHAVETPPVSRTFAQSHCGEPARRAPPLSSILWATVKWPPTSASLGACFLAWCPQGRRMQGPDGGPAAKAPFLFRSPL